MGMISDGYRFIPTAKEQHKRAGEKTIADQKVANGIYHHTIAGVLCSQLLPQALLGGANLLFNGSNDSGNDDDYSVSGSISELHNFNKLKDKYQKALDKKDYTKANELYSKLDKYKASDNPTINLYKNGNEWKTDIIKKPPQNT